MLSNIITDKMLNTFKTKTRITDNIIKIINLVYKLL
jgi:hypothetical protein